MLAVAVLIVARHRSGLPRIEPVVWPIQLYSLALPYIAILLGVLTRPFGGGGNWYGVLRPGHPAGFVLATVILAALTYRYSRNERALGLFPATFSVVFGVFAFVAVTVSHLPGLLLNASRLIVAIAVAAAVVISLRTAPTKDMIKTES